MIGLRDLLLGVTYSILKQYPDAARALNTTIQKRESIFDEAVHILAFAHYELATVILQLNQNVSFFFAFTPLVSNSLLFFC